MGKRRQDSDGVYPRAIRPKADALGSEEFPFSLGVVRNLREIRFTTPVTFFVGENGSGKSTLLETIAATAYDDVEHVSLTRAFLADPKAFYRRP